MLSKLGEKYHDQIYAVFRIAFGLLFAMHGGQKLFGWFGGNGVELMSLFGAAGIIEFFGGLAIALGLFTRLVAAVSAVEMAVAYGMVHASKALVPLQNGGEPALLFLFGFLMMIAHGGHCWSLEKKLFGKERF